MTPSPVDKNPEQNATDAVVAALPERYQKRWREPFDALIAPALIVGVSILDVGCGRRPVIAPEARPPGCRYVALDLSASELAKAPVNSYDAMFETDVAHRLRELEGCFDLVVSWQVLEHVKPLDRTLENLHAYLRPRGRLVALLSGTFSAFGLINKLVPQQLGAWSMKKLLGRDPSTVFPAYYHLCWYNALKRELRDWSACEISPFYCGARYFRFSRAVLSAYLCYEEWAMRTGRYNLATHYLIHALK